MDAGRRPKRDRNIQSQNSHQQNTELTRRRSKLARVYKIQGESLGLRERLVLPHCGEPARDVWPLG